VYRYGQGFDCGCGSSDENRGGHSVQMSGGIASEIDCGYERRSFVGGGILWGNVSAGNGCGRWVFL
jgi:hypothetical protein